MTAAVMAEWGVAGAFGIGVVAGLHPCPLSALGGAVLLVLAPDSGQRQWRTTAWRAGVLVLGMVVAVTLVAAVVGHGLRHIHLFSVQLPELLPPDAGLPQRADRRNGATMQERPSRDRNASVMIGRIMAEDSSRESAISTPDSVLVDRRQ